jgi:hypothetical protein
MDDKDVFLAYIHGGIVQADFMSSVVATISGPGRSPHIGAVAGASLGALVAMARNAVTLQFLESGLPWLWFVDTDMVFGPATINRLMEIADPEKVPILSALTYRIQDIDNQAATQAVMYYAGRDADDTIVFIPVENWEKGETLKVDAVGAGCILVHRGVFLRIRELIERPFWWSEVIVDGQPIGEDLSFCLRAAAAEIPIHVATGIGVGHIKQVIIGDFSPE